MGLVLGIDLGTSYFKIGAFDRQGRLCGLSRPAVPKEGTGGRCELPVESFWETLRAGVAATLTEAGARPGDVRALGYSSQANSFVLLAADSRPLTPLILWLDRRAEPPAAEVAQLFRRPDFLAATGLGIDPTPEFLLNKLCWFRKQEPELWRRAALVQTISDTLSCGLTGRRQGDAGTAALIGLLDLRRGRWWDEALAAMELKARSFSTPVRPGTPLGPLTAAGAERLGLASGALLAVGSLDHHAAALGSGVGRLAELCESTGTVLACLRLSGSYRPRAGCCMGPGHREGSYYQFTFNDCGANGLEWYQRHFAPELSIPQLLELAEPVPPGCEGLAARPEIHKCRPDDAFVGQRLEHGHGYRVRAILETSAAALAGLVDRLCPDGRPGRILATGGGARSRLWLQIKADRLGMEVVRSRGEESACRGAAMFAAVTAGWHDSLEAVSEAWIQVEETFSPRRDP